MPSSVPPARRRLAAALLAAALTTACGPDLGKQNFARTTVTASAAADGPIDDPAVRLDVLRVVDPCALVDAESMAVLGTPVADARYSDDPEECADKFTDAGGKELRLRLTLGDLLTGDPDGAIEGLPSQVSGADATSCTVSAFIQRAPSLGISAQVGYEGGDPCGAGRTALQKVLQRLHDNPAQLDQPKGTLLAVDFCTLLDEGAAATILGKGAEADVTGLHGCSWYGGAANGYFDYSESYRPVAGDDGQQVDLGGGVTGYQELETNAGKRCTIKWTHRPIGDDQGEIVRFQYDNFHDDAAGDDACGKALAAVRAALPKLPRP